MADYVPRGQPLNVPPRASHHDAQAVRCTTDVHGFPLVLRHGTRKGEVTVQG